MTAINVIIQKDLVAVVTDSAFYDAEGRVQQLSPKAAPIPSWPGIVAVRGPIYVSAFLSTELGIAFRGIDEFKLNPERMIYDFCARQYDALTKYGGPLALDIFVTGVSASGECQGVFVSVREENFSQEIDAEDEGFSPFEVTVRDIGVPEIYTAPQPDVAKLKEAGAHKGITPGQMNAATMQKLGLQILNVQRQQVGSSIIGGNAEHFVGGYPCYFILDKHGTITIRVGEAWPDVVGEFIDPGSDAKSLGVASAVSDRITRQQRRAALSQSRKAPAHG